MNELEPQSPGPLELRPTRYYTGTLTANPTPEEWAKIIARCDAALLAAWDAWEAREKNPPA